MYGTHLSVFLIYLFVYYLLFLFLVYIILQPYVDFGLKLMGADLMSVPGAYRIVQV